MLHFRIILLFAFSFSLQAQTHNPEADLQKMKGKSNEGQLILTQYCLNCHAKKPLIPLNAPTIGDSVAWKPRIKQGIDALFEHTAQGFNAMPARGGCFECTDEQLRLAIEALLPQKKTNTSK
jgi:cytochrome c5